MKKITGIKSVDFKIISSGYGSVNNNGSISIVKYGGKDNDTVSNHTIPKLRNFTPYTIDQYGFKKVIDIVKDFNVEKHKLYVSTNAIRNALFNDEGINLTNTLLAKLISNGDIFKSQTGLLRGYFDAKNQFSRKSPLLLEDFIDTLGNANPFEQFSNSKSGDDKNSIFSKTTFGETKYISYGSISIEDLQFICFDGVYGRAQAFEIGSSKIEPNFIKLANEIADYIKASDLNEQKNRKPEVTFGRNFVRENSINPIGEFGLILNDDAIDILVDVMIDKISNLSMKQAKGHLEVDEIIVDYNDGKAMRIKKDETDINTIKDKKYAIYYKDTNEDFYDDKKELLENKKQTRSDNKDKKEEIKNNKKSKVIKENKAE